MTLLTEAGADNANGWLNVRVQPRFPATLQRGAQLGPSDLPAISQRVASDGCQFSLGVCWRSGWRSARYLAASKASVGLASVASLLHEPNRHEVAIEVPVMTDSPEPAKELTVRELTKLWGVTEQCVYKWKDAGRVELSKSTKNGQWVAPEDVAKAAKVMRTTDAKRWLEKRGVPPTQLDLQLKLNVIEPHLLETNGEERFSINDVETVERLFREAREDDAQTQAAPTVEAPPSQEERDPDARDRRRALQDYLESGKSPCDLPVWFWEIPDPIPFVPPLDVFRYEYATRRFDEKLRDFITDIKRSAGYSRNNEGKVVRVLEDPAFSVELDLHPAGVGPAQFEHQNLMYELARQDWYEQIRLHGLGTGDSIQRERRDREGAIRRYIATRGRPCDLPDWFWDTPELPPFEPPLQVFWYQCGEQFVQEKTGQPKTYMTRSAGWGEYWTGSDLAPEIHYMPFDPQGFVVDGFHPPGTVPAEFAEDNWRYIVAWQEWMAEWRRRHR